MIGCHPVRGCTPEHGDELLAAVCARTALFERVYADEIQEPPCTARHVRYPGASMCCPTAQHVHSRMGCKWALGQCPVFDLTSNQDYTVLEILSLCVACGGQMSRMFLAGDTAQQCIAGMRYPSGTGWGALQMAAGAQCSFTHPGTCRGRLSVPRGTQDRQVPGPDNQEARQAPSELPVQ